jgi:CheY-like chemotaxis protein
MPVADASARHVLIVDDDPHVRGFLRRVLHDYGEVRLLEAADGVSALATLLSQPIALVLLDLSMPIMSGLETLAAIRRSPVHANLPVIILTSEADRESVTAAARLGTAGYVLKPITLNVFRERLIPLLDAHLQRDAPVSSQPLLTLSPEDRVLLVDHHTEHRTVAREVLSRICQVEIAEHEFAAMQACAGRVPHPVAAMFFGALSPLSSIRTVAATLRAMQPCRPRCLVAMVAEDEAEATRQFDIVLGPARDAEDFERALAAVSTPALKAALLLHPKSSWIAHWFEAARRTMSDVWRLPLTVRSTALPAGEVRRWSVGALDVHAVARNWTLELTCPAPMAHLVASRSLQTDIDEMSDEMTARAMNSAIEAIGGCLQERFRAEDIAVRLGDATTRFTNGGDIAALRSPSAAHLTWSFESREVATVSVRAAAHRMTASQSM